MPQVPAKSAWPLRYKKPGVIGIVPRGNNKPVARGYADYGGRRVFDLDCDEDRAKLSGHVAAGEVASLQTREFNFRETFLKLTGTEFT